MKTTTRLTILFLITLANIQLYAQLVTPGSNGDGTLYLNVANTYFEVDPTFGAHISAYKLDDENIIFGNKQDNGYLWGSTLWQSPQSTWNWPPSLALDQDPYSGGIVGNNIDLLSDEDGDYNSHLTFRKVFNGNTADTSINIIYTLNNNGTTARSWSAWELTRVPASGMAFFPFGSGSITGAFAGQVEKSGDIAWYKYDQSDPQGNKYFSDGAEGWDAWLSDSGILYIRKFEDVDSDNQAPGEKEIELWFNGHGSYIELELQSAYTSIDAGSSFSWNVKWLLRKVPANISLDLGSTALAEYTRGVVSRAVSAIEEKKTKTTIQYAVYPNPTNGTINFESMVQNPSKANVKIYTIQGAKVFESAQLNNSMVADISALAAGIYQYVISQQDGTVQIGKIILEK